MFQMHQPLRTKFPIHCLAQVGPTLRNVLERPMSLPLGHHTVAFNGVHISNTQRVVTDESARASFEMLNSVFQRASQLRMSSPRFRTRRAGSPVPSYASKSDGCYTSFASQG